VNPVRALHVRLEALTASFRHPLILSGTQVSTPMPAYSNVLGMLSACAGRIVTPDDVRIGFEFHCDAQDIELERTSRWQMDKQNRLKPHSKGSGINRRQVFWRPCLDLYIANPSLRNIFERPTATPCFGRSQDIAWIKWIRDIDLHPVPKGRLGPTLIPLPQPGIAGLIVRLPEWFENTEFGKPRKAGSFGHYYAMLSTTGDLRFEITRSDLFRPSDAESAEDVIYLHHWLSNE
jgi:CRISPR-associated protein Cas5t